MNWQQLCLELFLCAVCLISCAHSTYDLPDYDDYGIHYDVKRSFESEEDCRICIMTFDLESCTRCRNGKMHIIPYYTAKRNYYMARSSPASSNMCGCCAITRLSNNYCCTVCNASKRGR